MPAMDVRQATERHVTLDVLTTNEAAAAIWEALGFVEIERRLAIPAAALAERLAAGPQSPTPR
jgi:ribosomal protein S18 acetylase RimI-like enzyme